MSLFAASVWFWLPRLLQVWCGALRTTRPPWSIGPVTKGHRRLRSPFFLYCIARTSTVLVLIRVGFKDNRFKGKMQNLSYFFCPSELDATMAIHRDFVVGILFFCLRIPRKYTTMIAFNSGFSCWVWRSYLVKSGNWLGWSNIRPNIVLWAK